MSTSNGPDNSDTTEAVSASEAPMTARAPEPTVDEAAPEVAASKDKNRRQWDLQVDHKGAQINTALYLIYTVVCLLLAIKAEAASLWFYVFYFLTFLAIFQGGTIVLRHCFHKTPKATVALELIGKKAVHMHLKNGSTIELSRDIDYTRKKGSLILSGKTHDNQSYSEVIRQGALPEGELDRLVQALKRFR